MAASRPPDTLVAWVAAIAGASPDRAAAIDGRDEWSYARLWARARDVGQWLLGQAAFEPGRRVALIGANEPEYLAAYFGVLRARGIVVPLNTLLSASELRAQIQFAGCVGTLVGDVDPQLVDAIGATGPVWRFSDVRDAPSTLLPTLAAGSPACVLLTSGSTGHPKGVLHTQGTLLHAALQIASVFPFARDERSVAFLPFFASIPEQVLPVVVMGGALDIIRHFDLDLICARSRHATSFDAVPTLMARLLDHGDVDALRALRWVMFASEPMPIALLERWWDLLPTTETHQLYGMTEMLTITNASHELLRREPDVVGVPFATSEVAILDAGGVEVPHGTAGEVVCRSPARMAEYLHDREATALALTPTGAMRTGDLGVMDERGQLRLTGRLKDVIISGGLNVSPAEIEAVACRHPLVSAAAVVGIPDAHWGETPIVVAVPATSNGLSASDLLDFCRAGLSGFKRPSGAAVMESPPLTGIGKLSKAEILRRVLEGEVELVRAK